MIKEINKKLRANWSWLVAALLGFITLAQYAWIRWPRDIDPTFGPPEATHTPELTAYFYVSLAATAIVLLLIILNELVRRKKISRLFHLIVFSVAVVGVGASLYLQVFATPAHTYETSRAGQVPIRVHDQGTGVNVDAVIAPWNRLAGRRILVKSSSNPHIVFRPSPVQPYTWVKNTYPNTCYINVGRDYGPDTQVQQHELGHCLGIQDHVTTTSLRTPRYRNAKNVTVCDQRSHPRYSPYRGIMSYCDWNKRSVWFGRDDKQTLRRLGYSRPVVNKKPTGKFTANCNAIRWQTKDSSGSPRVRLYVSKSTGSSVRDWNNKGPFARAIKPARSGNTNNGSWAIPNRYKNANKYRVFVVISDKLPDGRMSDLNYVRATPAQGAVYGPCRS